MREELEYNYSYYPVIFSTEAELLTTKEELNQQEIFPRRYFYPSLNKLPYVNVSKMPVAEDISQRILCLPLFAELEETSVHQICDVIKSCVL